MRNFIKNPGILGIFFLILGTFVAFSGFNKGKIDTTKTTALKMGVVKEVVSSSGSVTAGGITEVFSPTKGIINKLLVNDGDRVKKDQPLVAVTSTATESEKAQALSDLYVARVALKKAENDRNTLQSTLETARKTILETENTKKVFDENVLAQKPNPSTGRAYTEEEKLAMASSLETSRKNFSNIEKQYLDSSEAIKSAQIALAEANVAYKATMDTTIKSPVEGIVSNLKKAVGNSVDTEKALLVVKSSPDLVVEINVSEFNISKIKKNQITEVTFDALPGVIVPARVLGFDMVGNENLGTVSYGVTVILEPTLDQEEKIRPAMTANVTITTNEASDVLVIPRSAVKLDDGKYYAMKVTGNMVEKQELQVGLVGSDNVEIKSGLKQDDVVLTVFEDKNEE